MAIASAFYNSKWKNKNHAVTRTDRGFIYCSFEGPLVDLGKALFYVLIYFLGLCNSLDGLRLLYFLILLCVLWLGFNAGEEMWFLALYSKVLVSL